MAAEPTYDQGNTRAPKFHRETLREFCEKNGWGPGTRIKVAGNGREVWVIKHFRDDGRVVTTCGLTTSLMWNDDWEEVLPDPPPDAQVVVTLDNVCQIVEEIRKALNT